MARPYTEEFGFELYDDIAETLRCVSTTGPTLSLSSALPSLSLPQRQHSRAPEPASACGWQGGDTLAVDAVLIATRHDTHAQIAAEALRRGKHVLLEKPHADTHVETAQAPPLTLYELLNLEWLASYAELKADRVAAWAFRFAAGCRARGLASSCACDGRAATSTTAG